MLDHVLDILRQQFGDHFVGIGIVIVSIILTIRHGVKEIQTWIKVEILDPYLAPTIAKVESHDKVQHSHTELLIDHEKRIRHNENVNYILQGKVLGGQIHFDPAEDDINDN